MAHSALQPEDVYRQRRLGELAVSPDGGRVAFTVSEADPEADEWRASLFVVPADGSAAPARLTRRPGAASPAWSPDGTRLAFLAQREEDVALQVGPDAGTDSPDADDAGADLPNPDADDAGTDSPDADSPPTDEESDADAPDPTERQQVWAFDLARGGDARQVTAFEEGVEGFDWSPDGERLVVSARDPTADQRERLQARREEDGPVELERLQTRRDGRGFLDDVRTWLFVVDLASGERRRLDAAHGGPYRVRGGMQPAWGRGGVAFRACRVEDPDGTSAVDAHVVDPGGGEPRRLTDSTLRVGALRWGPAGDRLAFVAGAAENWYAPTEAYVADPEAGSYRSVSASLDRTLGRAGAAEWLDDDSLLAPAADGGRARLVRLSAGRDDPVRTFDRQGEYRHVAGFDAAGGTVALGLTAPEHPPDVFALPVGAVDAAEGDPDPAVRLTELNADLLDGVAVPSCRRMRFENPDGDRVEAMVTLPPGFDPDDPEPAPLVVAIHGGPTAFDAPRFYLDGAHWAGEGYVVLRVNYRGSTSYGREFSEVIRGEWGPRECADVLAGVDEVVGRGWADPDRLFVTGFSQGGINTAYLVTRTDRFAAAAAQHGIYDFRSLYGTGDLRVWYENDVGLPWDQPGAYEALSSLPDVDSVETPTLVTAGSEDHRCPAPQAEQLYVSLRRLGVPSKLVVYPVAHDAGEPGHVAHRLETVTDWFERHDPARGGPGTGSPD